MRKSARLSDRWFAIRWTNSRWLLWNYTFEHAKIFNWWSLWRRLQGKHELSKFQPVISFGLSVWMGPRWGILTSGRRKICRSVSTAARHERFTVRISRKEIDSGRGSPTCVHWQRSLLPPWTGTVLMNLEPVCMMSLVLAVIPTPRFCRTRPNIITAATPT